MISRVLSVLFVVAVPFFLVTTSVVWAVNDLRLYRYEFRLQNVAEDTGIWEEELLDVARQIRGYFNSRHGPLEVRAKVVGEVRELFNDREVQHMADVKRLIWGVYGVQWASFAYMLAWLAGTLALRGRMSLRKVGVLALRGCAVTVGLVVVMAIAAWISFDSLFRLFHRLSFANTLWQLDPKHDYLIRIFPEGFWFDATFFVGLATVVMALVLGVGAGMYLWIGGRRETTCGSR